jgi:hypothetical protein
LNVSKNPWIEVNGASANAVAEQVARCPSSALTYELLLDQRRADVAEEHYRSRSLTKTCQAGRRRAPPW